MPIKRATEDVTPTGPAFPFFQWGNGISKIAVNVKGKWQENMPAVGFFIDRTENEQDWTQLDAACSAAGFAPVYIGRKVGASAHWHAPQMSMLLLTTKLPKVGNRYSDRETLQKGGTITRNGISFGWKVLRDKGDDGEWHVRWQGTNPETESFLKPLVLVPALIAQGYTEPLMITVNGTMTNYMEAALRRHYELQDVILNSAQAEAFITTVQDSLVNDFGVEPPDEWQFPYYGSYLTLVDGGQELFGKGDKTTKCNVMVCAEPETLDDAMLEALCADANERFLCMEWEGRAIEWSLADSERNIALREHEVDEQATMKASLRAVNAQASKAAA